MCKVLEKIINLNLKVKKLPYMYLADCWAILVSGKVKMRQTKMRTTMAVFKISLECLLLRSVFPGKYASGIIANICNDPKPRWQMALNRNKSHIFIRLDCQLVKKRMRKFIKTTTNLTKQATKSVNETN